MLSILPGHKLKNITAEQLRVLAREVDAEDGDTHGALVISGTGAGAGAGAGADAFVEGAFSGDLHGNGDGEGFEGGEDGRAPAVPTYLRSTESSASKRFSHVRVSACRMYVSASWL